MKERKNNRGEEIAITGAVFAIILLMMVSILEFGVEPISGIYLLLLSINLTLLLIVSG